MVGGRPRTRKESRLLPTSPVLCNSSTVHHPGGLRVTLFNKLSTILSVMNIINKVRSWNYQRLADRSLNKAIQIRENAGEYEYDDPSRYPYEEGFMKQMRNFRERERKAQELSGIIFGTLS